jgi:hypothetical protein
MTGARRQKPRSPLGPLWKQPPSPDAARHDFAHQVVRRLVDSTARVAVIAEHGRPAMVDCRERLFGVLSLDHPIVGVYAEGARVPDIIEDLKAAGL